jgi:hypothetical protein
MKPQTITPIDFYDYLLKRNLSEHEVITWRGIHPGIYTNLPPIEKLPRLSYQLAPGVEDVMYGPTRVQRLFHGTTKENCILEGPRGTGKSLAIRMDAHMYSREVAGWKYLVIRRKLTDLKKSHLIFMPGEMDKLGGRYNKTDNIAYYPNESIGFFSYYEHNDDWTNLLSAQYDGIYIDEITTFSWDMVTKIASCLRSSEDSGMIAFLKGGTNPLGVGAQEVKRYFITKKVREEDDPEYDPENYEAIHTTKDDNPYLNWVAYSRRLGGLKSEKVRRAWLGGEWVNEGTYFIEWEPTRQGRPWHVIKELPTIRGKSILKQPWVKIYRSLDWGFRPDPAVCHWYAVLPAGNAIVFKERFWKETVAKKVAEAIKRESEGMRIIDTFADPSIFAKRGESDEHFSIGEIIENNGVPLTSSVNDRTRFGLSICDWLNTIIEEQTPTEEEEAEGIIHISYPKIQVLDQNGRLGCPDLLRTLPDILSDQKDQTRIADGGEDHFVVSLAYFCMGDAIPSRDPEVPSKPRWLMSKREFNKSFSNRL